MTANTKWFAQYLRDTRAHFNVSQQSVANVGGPHRQLQATIESGDETEISLNVMSMYDRAYGWPEGYTESLAELGEYATTGELPEALVGGERDRAVYAADLYSGPEHRSGVKKTLAALYDPNASGPRADLAPLGFDPHDGRVSYLEGPLLTNIDLGCLIPMIGARRGVTTIDTGVLNDQNEQFLRNYTNQFSPAGRDAEPVVWQRIGTAEPTYASARVIDPISEITNLADAKRLAADLMLLRPEVRTTAVSAGYTLLAIAAFGEDPLTTLTQLGRVHHGSTAPQVRDFRADFAAFWANFYDPTVAGPDLGQPDMAVCDLLAGVLAARDECLQVSIARGTQTGSALPAYQPHRIVKVSEMLTDDQLASVVLYDGKVVPEFPIVQSQGWPTRALTIYAAQVPSAKYLASPGESPRGQISPQFGRYPHRRIGIATADDRDIVARHHRHTLGTLTNYVAGQAIYCDSGRARRVWIPDR